MLRGSLLLAVAVAIAGCGGDSAAPTSPTTQLDPLRATLSGRVYDSLLGHPVGGVRVLLGDSSAVSSSTGGFAVRLVVGELTVVVDDPRYERVAIPYLLSHDQLVNVSLRAEAPYVLSCNFPDGAIVARVVDLQGRKSVNRRFQSTMTAELAAGASQSTAEGWQWTPVDEFTWRVTVPVNGTASRAAWRIEDDQGHVAPSTCVQSTVCLACSAGSQP